MLASERRLGRTKECNIWIPYAKVMNSRIKVFFGRSFEIISSTYIPIGFGDAQYIE